MRRARSMALSRRRNGRCRRKTANRTLEHHGRADDLGARLDGYERVALGNPRALARSPFCLKPGSSDRTAVAHDQRKDLQRCGALGQLGLECNGHRQRQCARPSPAEAPPPARRAPRYRLRAGLGRRAGHGGRSAPQWLVPSEKVILFQTLYFPEGLRIGSRATSSNVAAS